MMIIECQACRARFKLDESRITGKGARIRCRKCGESIIVMKSDIAPPGITPPPEKEHFDLRAVLRGPEQSPPVSPRDEGGTYFEHPLAPEQERRPSPPVAQEEPSLQAEVEPSLESPLLREEQPFSPPAAEEQAPPTEREWEVLPGEVAEPPADQASLPRDDVADAFEALFHRDREEVTNAQQPAPTTEGPDIVIPVGAGDREDIIVFREDGEDLTLDPNLPGFLRKEQPAGEQAAAFDISEHLRDAPFEIPGEETTRPEIPDLPLLPEGPSLSRADADRDELIDLTERGEVEEPPHPASPPPDVPPPSSPERKRTERTSSRRPSPSGRPLVALLVLLFLALAGGGAYLAFTKTGQETLRAIVPGMESLWLGGKGAASPYHVGNLIGYYETSDKAGKMFIIKGLATNQGRTKKSGIRIRAELLDGNKQRIAEKTVYAGNIITGLRNATREKIEAAMGNRFGDKLSNLDVAPGKAVPFMVTFFDPPDGIEEYSLEALDGE